MSIINRISKEKLASLLREGRDVVLVQGARQVGKTTLVEQVIGTGSHVFSINLERDLDALRGIDRTNSFEEFTRFLKVSLRNLDFDSPGHILFIDEAQESEHLGRYVRFMKEDWRHIKVILSGSSMSRIFRDDTRVPVGRIRPWLVTPLTFEEFLEGPDYAHLKELFHKFGSHPQEGLIEDSFHDLFLKTLDAYMKVGGLPAVVKSFWTGMDYRAQRRAIFDSQEDDFVRKSQITDRTHFAKGLRGVANYVGMPSKFSHVSDSKILAEKTLTALNSWHLLYEIEQKSSTSTTQHLPKRYLYDIGMAQDLRDMPFPQLSLVSTQNPALRTQLGGLFENTLLLQILADQSRLGDLSGWKKGGNESPEVDFIWRQDDHIVAIECKATQKVSQKHWSGLKSYLDTIADSGVSCVGVLVSAAPFQIIRGTKGTFINLPLYLASGKNLRNCHRLGGRGAV